MNKIIKKAAAIVTALAVLAAVFVFDLPNTVALAVTASGTYDSGLIWSLDNSGKLTISGSGNMPYLEEMQRPYRNLLNNITSVVIENGVRNIGGFAFYDCTALNDVTISNSVTSIDPGAFNECTALETIIIPDSVTSIDTNAFAGCTKLKNITISNSLEDIGRNAFNGCNALEVITIPSSVTFIGMFAFDSCSNLKNVTLESTTPPSVGLNAFPSEVTALYVPCNAIDTYKNAKVWSTYAAKIQPQHSGATEVRNVKAATCTAKGYTGDTYCKVCDTKLETGTEIVMTAHSYSTAWLKDSSNHWHKCENCTAINGEAAHTWDSGKVTTAATCTTTGTKTYTYTVCGQTKTENIAAAGHSTTHTSAKAASCTEDGNKEYWYCSTCKKYFSDSACKNEITQAQTVVNKTGHNWSTTWTTTSIYCHVFQQAQARAGDAIASVLDFSGKKKASA